MQTHTMHTHTHTHTYWRSTQDQFEEIRCGLLWLARAWFENQKLSKVSEILLLKINTCEHSVSKKFTFRKFPTIQYIPKLKAKLYVVANILHAIVYLLENLTHCIDMYLGECALWPLGMGTYTELIDTLCQKRSGLGLSQVCSNICPKCFWEFPSCFPLCLYYAPIFML